MFATQSLLLWLGCITPALTAVVTPPPVQPSSSSLSLTPRSDTIYAVVNAQGDVVVDTPPALASLLAPHFDTTCTPVSKKRRGKRDLSDKEKSCIAYSAFSLAVFAAKNLDVRNALSSIPLDFDVIGGWVDIKNEVRDLIQQRPSEFPGQIFAPSRLNSTVAYFSILAGWVEQEQPGQEITHNLFKLSDTETQATASCSSWTFTWTSPTPSLKTVPAAPCIPIETGIQYEGIDPIMWAADIASYQSALASFNATSSSSSASIPSPTPGDTICRTYEYWEHWCPHPNTKNDRNDDLETCIANFQDPTQNPTWPSDGIMQSTSSNISMPCSSNKGTVFFVIYVSWDKDCQAPNGKMNVTDPMGTSDPNSEFTLANIIRKNYKGCLDYALFTDKNTRMVNQVPNSAGSGQQIVKDHANDDQYSFATNWGEGGRRQIGCLNYDFFSSYQNDGINNDMTPFVKGRAGTKIFPDAAARTAFYKSDWPNLGPNYYALNPPFGRYCPNTYKGTATVYPCPAWPCWDGPLETPVPPLVPHSPLVPHHGELLVKPSNATSSNATLTNDTMSDDPLPPTQLDTPPQLDKRAAFGGLLS